MNLKTSLAEEESLIDEMLRDAAQLVHHGLARRMAARTGDATNTVAIISDDGVYMAPRDEASRLLLRVEALRPLSATLDRAPPAGHLWALCLKGQAAALRPFRLDRTQLTIRRPPTLSQEQFLEALLLAAAPAIRHALTVEQQAGAGADLAVFMHDTGPGVIQTRTLQELLKGHGYFYEAEQLAARPRDGHVWVWLSTWQEGGTTGLRQLPIATAPGAALRSA